MPLAEHPLPPSPPAGLSRPNVLLINSHDSGRFFGCYGVNTVRTPAVDRLAREGVLLENFTAASPICSPSRGAMVTGRWPQRNGLLGLTHHGFRLHPDERHVAAMFLDAGYHTALFHFQHVAPREEWPNLGFQEFLLRSSDDPSLVYPHMARPAPEVGAGVADWLRQQAEAAGTSGARPFFAQVNFNETHTPFWFGGAKPESIQGVTVPRWIEGSPAAEAHFAELQGAVAALDEGVGWILTALDSTGLADNTLVVFATDHGLEATRDKWTCYESGLGIAGVVRLPAQGIVGGRRLHTPLSNVDLLPTLLDCAGLPAPTNRDGVSFAATLRGGDEPSSERPIFSIYHNGGFRSVRRGRWKLIRNLAAEPYLEAAPVSLHLTRGPRYARPPAELFDLEVDPQEAHNLAATHPDLVTELSALLGAWMRNTQDPACF
jgi:N-sulfoglucosamine sulfohydrolase